MKHRLLKLEKGNRPELLGDRFERRKFLRLTVLWLQNNS